VRQFHRPVGPSSFYPSTLLRAVCTKQLRAAWRPPRRRLGERNIGHGRTTVTVVVERPEVEHTIRMRDFEAWLESNGRSPAEMDLKSRLRELLRR
jgi:hypothetical protein